MCNAAIESIDDIPTGITNPQQVILEENGVRLRAVLREYEEVFEGVRMKAVSMRGYVTRTCSTCPRMSWRGSSVSTTFLRLLSAALAAGA